MKHLLPLLALLCACSEPRDYGPLNPDDPADCCWSIDHMWGPRYLVKQHPPRFDQDVSQVVRMDLVNAVMPYKYGAFVAHADLPGIEPGVFSDAEGYAFRMGPWVGTERTDDLFQAFRATWVEYSAKKAKRGNR